MYEAHKEHKGHSEDWQLQMLVQKNQLLSSSEPVRSHRRSDASSTSSMVAGMKQLQRAHLHETGLTPMPERRRCW